MIIEAPISMRSNTRIRRFINKTLIPQISKEIGKNIQDIEDLV